MNLYAYVYNDPPNRTDPTGRAGVPQCTGTRICGTPQKTGTPGHDKASEKVGQQAVARGAKEVHYNRPLSTSTGDPNAGNQRPDVTEIDANGKVNTTEIVSKSQTVAQMDAKGQAMQSKLSPEVRGTHQSLTVEQAMKGGVKSGGGAGGTALGIAGFVPGIANAIMESIQNPNTSSMELLYRAAGMGQMWEQAERVEQELRPTTGT